MSSCEKTGGDEKWFAQGRGPAGNPDGQNVRTWRQAPSKPHLSCRAMEVDVAETGVKRKPVGQPVGKSFSGRGELPNVKC